MLDLKTGRKKILIRGGSHAEYVSTGHLVYGVDGTLRAVSRLEVLSDPVPVLDQVTTKSSGAANFSVSQHGTLAYIPGHGISSSRKLVWVDRQGHEEPVKAPPRAYIAARISPDGSRVALTVQDPEFYMSLASAAFYVVPVQTTSANFTAGTPTKLFDTGMPGYAAPVAQRSYDVSPDGRRFLMIKTEGAGDQPTQANIVVVERWFDELTQRAPK